MNLFMTKNNVKENKEKISDLKSIIDGLGDNKNLPIEISKPISDVTFDANQLKIFFTSLENFKSLESKY
jgi:hypothetical protein